MKLALVFFGLAFAAVPVISSAQIVATNASASVGSLAAASPACPSPARSLAIGASGNDVAALQTFLAAQGFFSVSATGYFGPITASAVGKWQAQNGVAQSGNAGFGIFGPLSRAALARSCGSAQGQTFSAAPQSGQAPLTVTFTTNDSITASSAYSVDFGDGASAAMARGSCVAIAAIVGGQGGIRCAYNASHVYASNGTYTARLLKNTCPAGAQCFAGPQTAGTVAIVVGSSAASGVSFTASPSSGAAPLSVQFMAAAPQGATFGNTVNFGDGTIGTLGFVPVCSSCNAEGVVSHTYASAGTYTASLATGACACPANGICNCPNQMILGTATVTVSSAGSAPAQSIQQLNAPGQVSLSQNGIAEIRNESFYFTLNSFANSSATIQITPVGCWNSFPSDTPPKIMCMLAMLPIPPQTLSIGQTYAAANYSLTLQSIQNNEATFSVNALSTNQ